MSVDHIKFQLAQATMAKRLEGGAPQEESLIKAVTETVIIDRLVPPRSMKFFYVEPSLRIRYQAPHVRSSDDKTVTIHRHALNQLCSKVSLPMTYVNLLNVGSDDEWRRDLLSHNLNELFHKPEWLERGGAPSRFLHRIVGDELRGFLSRRYNRHLASAPLLRAFVESCKSHDAKAFEATNSPVRVSLKCLLPKVFSPFPGEHVCFGSEWANSDFGAGRLTVSQTVWRVNSNSSSVLDETFGRVHLGSVIEDSDVEMSDDTAKKEVEAQQGAIRDAVNSQFAEKTIERLLKAIHAANDEEIPWHQLRGQLARFLSKVDIEQMRNILDTGDSIIDLPPVSAIGGSRVPTAYWAASYVGVLAAKSEDEDRRLELQKEAGKLLAAALKGT